MNRPANLVIVVRWRKSGPMYWTGYAYDHNPEKARRYRVPGQVRRIAENLMSQWVAKGRPTWKIEKVEV